MISKIMTPKISNTEKILLVLKEMNCKVSSKDLSEFTGINDKNIGRYLTQLETKRFISRKVIQEGKKRYNMNSILSKGKRYKFTITYKQFIKELSQAKEEIHEVNRQFGIGASSNTTVTSAAVKENISEIYLTQTLNNTENKMELIHIFKILAVRDIDAEKLGLKNKEALNKKIIDLIFKL